MTTPDSSSSFSLTADSAVAELLFLEAEPADPLGEYPTLRLQARPYNLWLTDEILQPALVRWHRSGPPGRLGRQAHRAAFEASSQAARLAFAQVLPLASAAGEPAVLAAMGVTANLQRTLALLTEFVLAEPATARARVFRLSRRWAGLWEYPEHAAYFPAGFKPPAAPAKVRPQRRDPRHLSNALWCSADEVKTRCADAIERLRREIRQDPSYSGE